MNANETVEHAGNATIDVDTSPILLRLRPGAAIFVARGEAWITEEGRPDDFIVAQGERFDVTSRQPLVISATRGSLQLRVVAPAAARQSRRASSSPAHDEAQLRGTAVASLGIALMGCGLHVLGRMRTALAPRPRLPTHG